jgi:hypothetical protein
MWSLANKTSATRATIATYAQINNAFMVGETLYKGRMEAEVEHYITANRILIDELDLNIVHQVDIHFEPSMHSTNNNSVGVTTKAIVKFS